MPWSNQGGGPWGSGPKGPWGGGSPPSGSSPPDLEELLRRGQDKLRTVLPGGNLSGRRDVAVVVTGSNAGGAEASNRACCVRCGRSGGLSRSTGPPSAQRRGVSVEIAW